MKDWPHPLAVLIGVLVVGLLGIPWLKYHKVLPSGTLADGFIVAALIGFYYIYKSMYDKQNPKK
jgi:hypothetical protein